MVLKKMKRKISKFKKYFVSVFRKYSCHVCENSKRIWLMYRCNLVNPIYSGNICRNCWDFTEEEPFFFCEVCMYSKPYDRMIKLGKKRWICTDCDNPSGVSTKAS